MCFKSVFLDIFVKAVESVLHEPRFCVPSQNSAIVLNLASSLCIWMKSVENDHKLNSFTSKMVTGMRKCFQHSKDNKLKKDKMWGLYHSMRTSSSFETEWMEFLNLSIGMGPSPFFCQHVTDFMFEELIEADYSVKKKQTIEDSTIETLTVLQQNALRYVAGYVCRKLQD